MPRTHQLPGASLRRRRFLVAAQCDTGNDAFVANGYFTYQFNPNLWLGMSLNSPFGLSESFPELWAGRDYASKRQQTGDVQCVAKLGVSFQRLDKCRHRSANSICQGQRSIRASRYRGQVVQPHAARRWMGLRANRRRHAHANSDDHDRNWIPFSSQSGDRREPCSQTVRWQVFSNGSIQHNRQSA